MTAAPRSSRLPGVPLPDGGAATPSPAHVEVGDRTAQERAQAEAGRCPHCGGYNPAPVICHNPDCLHSESLHDGRGACSFSTGPKATPCRCTAYVPNPETPLT